MSHHELTVLMPETSTPQSAIFSVTTEEQNLWLHLHDAIVAIDHFEQVCLWNLSAEKVLGLPSNAAIGRHYSEVLISQDNKQPELSRLLESSVNTPELTIKLLHPQGEILPLKIQSFPLPGNPSATALLIREIKPVSPSVAVPEERIPELLKWLENGHDLQPTLTFIAQQIGEVLCADICRLWVHPSEPGEAAPSTYEYYSPALNANHSTPPALKLSRLKDKDGQAKTLYVPDTLLWEANAEPSSGEPANADRGMFARHHSRSLLQIPLHHQGKSLGVLQAECLDRTNPWHESMIQQTHRLSDALAELIYRDQQEKQQQAILLQRARQQEMLAVLSQRALLEPYFPIFVELTAVMVSKTLEVDRCRILECPRKPGGMLTSIASIGYQHQWPEASTERPVDSLAAYTLACNQPVIAEDMGSETRFADRGMGSEDTIKSGAAVPIGNTQGNFGVLEVGAIQGRTFHPHDISFLQAVANVVGHVAEKAQAKQVQAQEMEPYKPVLDAAGYGFLIFKAESGEVHCNERFCELLGRGPEFTEIPVDLLQAWIHPMESAKGNALFSPAVGQDQPVDVTLRFQHAWGHFVAIRIQGLVVCNAFGKLVRVAALCQLAQENKSHAADVLPVDSQEAELFNGFRQLMASNSVGFIRCRADGTIVDCNNTYLSIIGYDRDDLTSGRLNWRLLTPPESATQDEQALRELSASGVSKPFQKRYRTKAGDIVDVLLVAISLSEQTDDYFTLALDVTEKTRQFEKLQRKLAQEQLRNRISELGSQSQETVVSLHSIATEIGRFFQSDRCIIARWPAHSQQKVPDSIDPLYLSQYRAQDELEPVGLHGMPSVEPYGYFDRQNKARWISLPNSETFAHTLRELDQTHPDSVSLTPSAHQYWKTYRLQAFFSIRIRHRNQDYGSLSLHQCAYGKNWSSEDLEFLEHLAHHLGHILHREAQERKELQTEQGKEKQLALLKAFFAMQAHLLRQNEIPRLLHKVLQHLLANVENSSGFIAEIIPSNCADPQIKIRAKFGGLPNESVTLGGLHFLPGELKNVSLMMLQSAPDTTDPPGEDQWKGTTALPLMQGQQLIGVLGLTNAIGQPGFPGAEELETYVSLASTLLAFEHIENLRNKELESMQSSLALAQYQTAQLEKSNRDLEQFAAMASHDLQAPLRKVALFCDFLKSSLGKETSMESLDYLDRIQKGTKKMQSLIKTLLVISQINQQGRPFKSVNLGQVIQEVMMDLEEVRRETQGLIFVGDTMTIEADDIQMHQVLQNLLGNALKFHKPDLAPIVRVSAQPIDDHICEIIVSDNGLGFDEKHLNRIFKVYERLHTDREVAGTGLGLAIVQKIVERHFGAISASSIPGEGATFTIHLPIRQNRPPSL